MIADFMVRNQDRFGTELKSVLLAIDDFSLSRKMKIKDKILIYKKK